MKRWTFALAGFALGLAATSHTARAQQATAAPPATVAQVQVRPNTAIIPQTTAGFMRRHQEFLPIAQKGDIDVLFMGDSITDFWRNNSPNMGRRRRGNSASAPATAPAVAADATAAPTTQPNGPFIGKPVFDKYFGAWKVANFGISGDTTQGVLWRLQNGEGQGFHPKAIMLMIGTNNTAKNTPEEIAVGVADIVFEMRKDFPDAKILLLGVFPRGAADAPVRGQIEQINKIIATLHDAQHVFYLDIGSQFLAADGSIPKDIMSDSLHPTTKGYEIWAQAVKGPLEDMLK